MSDGPKSMPSVMALLPGIGAPIEYEANLASYFNPVITQILGNEAFIATSGYIGVKNLTPLRASPMKKRVRDLKI
jgi:hypothetical protein